MPVFKTLFVCTGNVCRSAFAEVLARQLASVHFPAIHRFDYYRRSYGETSLPNTVRFSERQLTLPLHPALNTAAVDRVVAALCRAVSAAA